MTYFWDVMQVYSLFQICNVLAFVSVEDIADSVDSGQHHETTFPSMTPSLIIIKYAFEV